MKNFKEKLALVPTKPGSYQMKNKDGVIIYVGKAKNLKNRLKSYFTGTVTGKTRMLVEDIDDFEYIVTSSELESLILEITLIKKYDPKYNILLKDDKTYPYIELTNEKYPRLKIVRNTKRKKTKDHLYGPYPNVHAARKTVNMINRIYPLRKCDKLKKELCLYYHIHECLGYCVYDVDLEEVNKMKKEIISFLKGDSREIVEKIKQEMERASDTLNYERALELKKMLEDIDITLRRQKIDLNKNYQFDLINYYQDENYLSIEIFFIRDGLLFGRHNEIIQTMIDPVEEVVEYLVKFYDKSGMLPKELYLPSELNQDLIGEYFHIRTYSPQKGELKKLLDLAKENAKEQLELQEETLKKDDKLREEALEELKKLLHLRCVSRMESFDNSHLFGTFYVGGMVVFNDFLPLKNEYRKYKISTDVKDDLSAMKEVLYRRYYKVLMENLEKPDLIVMDGGKLQISVAKEIVDSLGLHIPIIGLVKDKNHKTSYIMNDKYEILNVSKDSNLFLFLTRIQEEVHRYAITYHRNIKSKGMLASVLDVVPGIGEVRKKELLKRFGSLKKLKEASVEELSEVVSLDIAKNLVSYLQEL
ncbi:MAG TPA: excinuclease ABC subunit UvrC [Candidatus Faecimonas gallistercoris]|nr:excinuclease ABC subunit UvrC [Candidatus Faecimonas gallistercoris]